MTVSADILKSFSMTTGVPAFIINSEGCILLSSRGFLPEEFFFVDMETLQTYIKSDRATAPDADQHYTFFGEDEFIYILKIDTRIA